MENLETLSLQELTTKCNVNLEELNYLTETQEQVKRMLKIYKSEHKALIKEINRRIKLTKKG